MEPLPYARPMPTQPRPAMYRLVITILLAGGVILLGLVATAAFFAVMREPHGRIFAIGPFLVAVLFFYIGIRSLRAAVQYLRGKTPSDEKAERWIFTIHSNWW
jgi:hypothetical protein